MKILKTGLIFALAVEVATAIVGFACLFGGIKTLGPIDYLMFPGGVLGWLLIWGDNFSNSAGERLGEIAISMATNAVAGFILGVVLAAACRLGNKLRTSNQASDATSEPAPGADSSSHQG
jgi:hypothetical protein